MTAKQQAQVQVLTVEDNVEIREALTELIGDMGYSTAEAQNGREALQYLSSHSAPRLILLDMMMPVMDGLQFRQEQLKDSRIASIPVVVITAYPRAPGLEGMEVLNKPIDMARLSAILGRYCESTFSGE
jgi:CheY-like chemotaxis protein